MKIKKNDTVYVVTGKDKKSKRNERNRKRYGFYRRFQRFGRMPRLRKEYESRLQHRRRQEDQSVQEVRKAA